MLISYTRQSCVILYYTRTSIYSYSTLDAEMNLEGRLLAAESFGTPHEVGQTAQ